MNYYKILLKYQILICNKKNFTKDKFYCLDLYDELDDI